MIPAAQTYVFENSDLIREIGSYIELQLPFILSFKLVREALKPRTIKSGKKWNKSKKRNFVTTMALFQWAQNFGCEFRLKSYQNNIFCYAAANDSIEMIQWVLTKYPKAQCFAVRHDVRRSATSNGHLETLKYIRSIDHSPKPHTFDFNYAAEAGHLHILQWLQEQYSSREYDRSRYDYEISKSAIAGGHLYILQWLRTQKPSCKWEFSACSEAARNGKLNILQWLRNQDPPFNWNTDCCNLASVNNHLSVLQWLRAQNPPCDWGRSCCFFAAVNNHLSVLQWLRSQDPPCEWHKEKCLERAEYWGYHEVLAWIEAQED